MAFSDLQMKTTADFALQTLHAKLAPVTDFAHNFRDLEDRKGSSIVIADYSLSAAGEFNADSNNYFSGVNEIDAKTVNLNKHFVKSLAVTDRDLVETELQFYRDAGIGIGDTLGRSIYGYVVGMLNDTNVTLSVESSLSSLGDFTDMFATVYANDMDIGQTVFMLTPTYYAKLLGCLPSNVYGGTDAIQNGRIPGLYGFKSVVCAPNMTEGWKGALVDANSVAIAARYLPPMGGAYPEAWKASDPISGLPIGFRSGCNLGSGVRYLAGEALVGASIIRPKGIVSIK